MAGTAKYATGPNYPNGGEWVANAPSNLETFSLLWRHRDWDVGFIDKRVGQMYNDNGTILDARVRHQSEDRFFLLKCGYAASIRQAARQAYTWDPPCGSHHVMRERIDRAL